MTDKNGNNGPNNN